MTRASACTSAFLLFFPLAALAQEVDELTDELLFLQEASQVEIPARHQQDIGMSPSAISVLTREDIQTAGCTSITDLLRLVPGIEVVFSSPFFRSVSGRQDFNISNNTYLLLIDGREANLELIGQPIWELPIALEDIERIEVIRGPGSALYGANAVAGVISITTRAIEDRASGWAGVTAGERSNLYANLRASTRTGNFGFRLSGGTGLMGTMVDPLELGLESYRFRGLAEYRWSPTHRVTADVGLVYMDGEFNTEIGPLPGDIRFVPVALTYENGNFRGQFAWTPLLIHGMISTDLVYAGLHLASFPPMEFDMQLTDTKLQWTLPDFWEPLLLIVGGRLRISWADVDHALDPETFSDPNSSSYHRAGIQHTELRTGVFLHAELNLADWLTLTAGSRLDYNSLTGLVLSPRAAAVFQPAPGHFLRFSAARAFRMPSALESALHPDAEFPVDSPFQTTSQQDAFREFMTRIIGNQDLDVELLYALEAGYRGEFLGGRLALTLDLYANWQDGHVAMDTHMVMDDLGFPDLQASSAQFENRPDMDRRILGAEVSVRYNPARHFSLLASWTHKEVWYQQSGLSDDRGPKNFFILGGRWKSDSGFVGSWYAFARSRFRSSVPNPQGMLEPSISQRLDDAVIFWGRAGWRFRVDPLELEAGFKMLLPLSPWSEPHFRVQERGGGESATWGRFGAEYMRRLMMVYLNGTY